MPNNLKEFNQATFADTPDLEDVEIVCIDCGNNFLWTIGEQVFFRDKGLQNPPKRCKDCKKAKNERLNVILTANETGIKQKIEVAVYCARCSDYTTVPFYPSQGRPVFCRSCFLEMNPLPKNGNDVNGNHTSPTDYQKNKKPE